MTRLVHLQRTREGSWWWTHDDVRSDGSDGLDNAHRPSSCRPGTCGPGLSSNAQAQVLKFGTRPTPAVRKPIWYGGKYKFDKRTRMAIITVFIPNFWLGETITVIVSELFSWSVMQKYVCNVKVNQDSSNVAVAKIVGAIMSHFRRWHLWLREIKRCWSFLVCFWSRTNLSHDRLYSSE